MLNKKAVYLLNQKQQTIFNIIISQLKTEIGKAKV